MFATAHNLPAFSFHELVTLVACATVRQVEFALSDWQAFIAATSARSFVAGNFLARWVINIGYAVAWIAILASKQPASRISRILKASIRARWSIEWHTVLARAVYWPTLTR